MTAFTKVLRRAAGAAHVADDFWTAGARDYPEHIVLDVEEGVTPSPKPPVRIFLGTEPRQHRAERVFVWSILQVRDPSRRYEIYLMKDVGGFDRRLWLTGFTNYRFAIPHWAGGKGRAIYNDVDQTYHSDPAELFDLDMDGHGYLAVSPKLTAVMLIDCERMAPVWTLDDVRTGKRKEIEAKAAAIPNLWGELPAAWHSRDEGYRPGFTKCLHYTTIHAQPWHPVPERYVYLPNPVGHVWHELERSADRAGFKVFTAERPSRGYTELVSRRRGGCGLPAARPRPAGLDELLCEIGGGTTVHQDIATPGGKEADAVLCIDALDFLPNDDVPWFVEALFDRARRAVYATISANPRQRTLPDGTTVTSRPQPASWWLAYFEAASARRPQVRWRVAFESRRAGGRISTTLRDGGGRHGAPKVWVLADDKPAHTNQSVALANALGWPHEVKQVRFNRLNRISNRLLGASLLSLDKRRSAPLAAPWPDVVIAAGRRSAPIARWIGEQTHGRTRLIQLGHKGGDIPEAFDVVVTGAYERLPIHRHRIETAAPWSSITAAQLAAAARRFEGLFSEAPGPHIVLLVGGSSAEHELDAATARRMGQEVRAFAEAAGGSAFGLAGPRTSSAAVNALSEALGGAERLRRWRENGAENSYLPYLARADAVVVSGESRSMLANAAAVKPVYIYPLPEKPPGLLLRLRRWVVTKAYSWPRKKKGTVRPQQGLEYVCARLIERGIIRPPRDLKLLHEGMIRRGAARRFGEPLSLGAAQPPPEIDEVAEMIREMLGLGGFTLQPAGRNQQSTQRAAA